ncbi:STAS-like domain-containing protein [Clostridium felsineum]|uniref:STAS-like domain-containing protein n=1 Tax=Clostridium felsineum TaxID=36839 RepID=UPI00214D7759|nr:STAS-like domain-containing protein [Clostridium felsineum]MCR3760330.1 STAS-like domain-containing protein [Clostridium felsineum]
MNNKNEIILFDIINSDSAETPEVGDKVYKILITKIDECINKDTKLIISFDKIKNITSAFLNNALGRLFFKYDWEKLISTLVFTGFTNNNQISTLKFTLTNAKLLSKNKKILDVK